MSTQEPVTPKGRRTRDALLDAGELVADRDGLAGLTIASVVAAAGVAKGTFYVYFSDREEFIDALHLRFYERVSAAVTKAVAGLEPGRELLLAAASAYLDVCLANRAVKALVFETSAQANLTTTMRNRQDMFANLSEPSIKAIGLTPTKVVARLFVSMIQEAAMIEMDAGRRVPGARAMLERLVS
jgi:TetR/AcrR family transcriptional repressor of nem operon